MKTVIFVLVLMKGSQIEDEGRVGTYQKCSWLVSQINRAGNNSPYNAYCKPVLVDKNVDDD